MSFSVLAIAPIVSGLPVLAVTTELARIGDLAGVTLTQLTGPVTKQRIIDRLSRGSYNAVLWIGHGEPGHLALDDAPIDPRWLTSQLKAAKVPLVILAACQTGQRPSGSEFVASFADVLPPAGISAIVMMLDVDDKACIEYDVAIIQALVAGESSRHAHEVGLEAIAHFPAMIQAPMLIPSDTVNGDIDALQKSVSALRSALASDQPGKAHAAISECVVALGILDNRIMRLEGKIIAIEHEIHPPPQVLAWRLAAILVVLFGGTLFWVKDTREILFAIVWVGLLLEIIIALLAATCWRMATMTSKEKGPGK